MHNKKLRVLRFSVWLDTLQVISAPIFATNHLTGAETKSNCNQVTNYNTRT